MSPYGWTLTPLKLTISPDGNKLEGDGVETGWFSPVDNRWMPVTFTRKCPILKKRFKTPLPPIIEFEVEYDCCQLNPNVPKQGLNINLIEVPDEVDRREIRYGYLIVDKGWHVSISYPVRTDLDGHIDWHSFTAAIDC